MGWRRRRSPRRRDRCGHFAAALKRWRGVCIDRIVEYLEMLERRICILLLRVDSITAMHNLAPRLSFYTKLTCCRSINTHNAVIKVYVPKRLAVTSPPPYAPNLTNNSKIDITVYTSEKKLLRWSLFLASASRHFLWSPRTA